MFYLDMNIIRDVTESRNTVSAEMFTKLREKGMGCYTSVFTWMEWTDNKQDDAYVDQERKKRMEYNKICRDRGNKALDSSGLKTVEIQFKDNLESYTWIKPIIPTDDIWTTALYISLTSSIAALDALHLSIALVSNCKFLVTRDSNFSTQCKTLQQNNMIPADVVVGDPDMILKYVDGESS